MKLHRKLIFEILAYTEARATNGLEIPLPELQDYTQHETVNHVKLCEEAGYIDTYTIDHKMPSSILRLTWQGHMELERMRTEGSGS